jgi:amino acid transporter
MVMASRVLYGLSSRGQLPKQFSEVHSKTRTPLYATLIVIMLVLFLAFNGSLLGLAEATSLIMLIIFSLVNLALWRIKYTTPPPQSGITFPIWVPITGFFTSASFVSIELIQRFL